jgi:hypothetical protein
LSIRVVVGLTVAAAIAAAAGCGGGGGGPPDSTAPTPPDRLAVTVEEPGLGSFRVDLECAIADRRVCADVIGAIASADDPERCVPRDGGPGSLSVRGTIEGAEVRAVLRRRTDCEVRAYDRVTRAIGL